MIFFLATQRNRHPMDRYLASWGRDFRKLIQPLTYDTLFAASRLRPGIYFFSDIEILSDAERERAGEVRDRLDRSGEEVVCFNHPLRSFRRYQLLTALRERGINEFSVARPGDDLGALRYPVFLRRENDHRGPQGELIHDPDELASALASVASGGREGEHGGSGSADEAWLITEFLDTSDEDGVFRKYSAIFIDGRVIPRHLFFSHDWAQKRADLTPPDLAAREDEYVRTNPHEECIREIFELAGIEYGRIDYGLYEGKLQVWEINTNPMLLSFMSDRSGPRAPVQMRFAEAISRIWTGLGSTPAGRHREGYPGQRMVAALYRYQGNPHVPALLRRVANKAARTLGRWRRR